MNAISKLAMALATVLMLAVIPTQSVQAQTFTMLHGFSLPDGIHPYAGLIQATNGALYGTTNTGGANSTACRGYSCGTVFKMALNGKLTTLYSFDDTDGANPYAGLIQATSGALYGTTYFGGANSTACTGVGCGTIFKITLSGTLTTLYNFCSQTDCTDGSLPYARLIQATNGAFYGTTGEGGANATACSGYSCGTVFKMTPSGKLTTLHSFDDTDGGNPNAGLIQATDGNFYGTTVNGGANSTSCNGVGCGTIFKITPSGKLTTLHSFDGTDGANPFGGVIQATEGDFYGTTYAGGGTHGGGTVFKMTASGTLTTLYSFCSQTNCTDGQVPNAGLIQATDGDFYGTTDFGGVGLGTIFKITSTGTLTTLHTFGGTDGSYPYAGLIQATDGNFYGTTVNGNKRCVSGGTNYGCGTVFRLSVGLGPFVETQTTSGGVGAAVKILGTNLTGATSVTFNGTAATFTVVSASEITTTVPTGATTGTVEVIAPGGTLESNKSFTVTP